MKVNINIELTNEDVEIIIQAFECLWDVEILGEDVEHENDEQAQKISNVLHNFYKLQKILE